jgi:RNA polymerase sigma-70 factor (ECF subfamily)
MEAQRTAETVARASYGRLIALLAIRSRDIAAAEDALAEAFRKALELWPGQGVPERPEAWLLTVARHHLDHGYRHAQVRAGAAATLDLLYEEAGEREPSAFPDERLKLLFVCAHPAIDPASRTPLMLQCVLGLDAARIGAAFLVPAATMGQRLVRAKAKIRDAGIGFQTPEPADLPERLEAVLAAIYAAYGTSWDAVPGSDGATGLAEEALYLARLMVGLLPGQPEALGLLALILYCEARAGARRDAAGRFVPLAEQDPALWSRALLIEAEGALTQAARFGTLGRFQIEAAIQSFHVQKKRLGFAPPTALVALYDLLMQHSPSIGAAVARAAVHAEAFGPEAGLAQLRVLVPEDIETYQPYWAALAHLAALAGHRGDAETAQERAIALTHDPAVRAYLRRLAISR